VNGVTRARCGAEAAADAFFQVGVRMAEQVVPPAEACLDMGRLLRITDGGGLAEQVFQRDAHAFSNVDDTHRSSTPKSRTPAGAADEVSVSENKCNHRPGEQGRSERDFEQPDPAD